MAAVAESTCPICDVATQPVNGHRALCFTCTLDELGESWEQIHERSAVVARKAAQRTFQGKAK